MEPRNLDATNVIQFSDTEDHMPRRRRLRYWLIRRLAGRTAVLLNLAIFIDGEIVIASSDPDPFAGAVAANNFFATKAYRTGLEPVLMGFTVPPTPQSDLEL